MNASLKKFLRHHFPNIGFMRKWMSEQKLKEYRNHFMAPETVAECERNPEKREAAIEDFCRNHPKFSAKVIRNYEDYMQRVPDQSKRPHMEELRTDVLFSCFAYGFAPDEYFAFRLEPRSLEERKTFLTDQERYLMVYRLNDIIDMDIFLDKYRTYEKYRKYYKRDAVCVDFSADRKAFLAFVKAHPVFVQKNVVLSKGDSVELTDIREAGCSPEEYFDRLAGQGTYILEEKVVQSAAMAALNPSSVNTVRCMTFYTDHKIEIGPCFLKAGQGSSFVDNAGAGGIVSGIDPKTGVVLTSGFDEFLNEYRIHPDTGTEFQNFQVPEWDQMIRLAKELSMQCPSVRYIGWDFAHTEDGWVIIEGNGSGQMIIPQIVFQRGFKNDIRTILGQDA